MRVSSSLQFTPFAAVVGRSTKVLIVRSRDDQEKATPADAEVSEITTEQQ
jgi:hypothetical protein